MKSVKIGVLGVSGHFIMRVLPSLLKSGSVEVYAIASRDGLKAKETSLKDKIPKYYSSYEDILKDSSIDIIYIPLPNNLHLEWVKKCADNKKHVICEKPFTLNAKEAIEAMEYAEKKGIKVMEAFMYKFHPQWKRAFDAIKFGELGKIHAIHTIFSYTNTDPKNIRNIKETGGGAIYDIGCYAVSSARFLMQSEPKRVISVVEFDKNFGTETLASAILDFGGARAIFTVGTQTFPSQKVEIFGTSGNLAIEIPFNMFADIPANLYVKNSVTLRCVEINPKDQYQLQFEAFADAVSNNKEIPVLPEDAVNNMKVLDALFKSSESGKWENV